MAHVIMRKCGHNWVFQCPGPGFENRWPSPVGDDVARSGETKIEYRYRQKGDAQIQKPVQWWMPLVQKHVEIEIQIGSLYSGVHRDEYRMNAIQIHGNRLCMHDVYATQKTGT